MSEPAITRHLPARDIPIPVSVSPEARAAMAMPPMEQPASPALDDLDAWRTMIAEYDAVIDSIMSARTADAPVQTEELDIDGVHVYQITPNDHAGDDRRVYLDIHGGAFINGRGEMRARDEGLEMPAAVVLMTPGVDLTGAGDSFQTNLGLDPLIQSNDKRITICSARFGCSSTLTGTDDSTVRAAAARMASIRTLLGSSHDTRR